MPDQITGTYTVAKADAEQQLVFGWANITAYADGTDVVDSHGDIIPSEELELAAYEFVLFERASGEDHEPGKDAALVESLFVTREKAAALAVDPFTGETNETLALALAEHLHDGWWVGFHIPDGDAFARAREGKTDLSIEGVSYAPEAMA